MTINETVLEMHFHRPLMDVIRDTFGLGGRGQMNFFKYSTQRECYIGFDQAYARTELSVGDFFDLLRGSAMTDGYAVPGADVFLGYFLQFKIGRTMQNRTKTTPASISARPYYRFKLDTQKNDNTGFSQHELLYLLGQNHGAFVYYACPMLFFQDELYDVDPDLDKLRLATVDDCPGPFRDHSTHHLFFNEPQADPVWASEPHDGTAIGPNELARALKEAYHSAERADSGPGLLALLTMDVRELSDDAGVGQSDPEQQVFSMVGDALTVVRISAADEHHA